MLSALVFFQGYEKGSMRKVFGIEFFSISEAAEMLGASVQRLHAMRRAGTLAAHPLKGSGGKAWEYFVTAESIRAAFNTPAAPPAATPTPPPESETPASLEARDRAARQALQALGVRCSTPDTAPVARG